MAAKRTFSDIHPSRRDQVSQPSRKRQKPDNLGAKSFKKAHPVNELKTRVRDLTRLLSREDDKLPAHIRVAKERELQTTQHELEESRTAERKSKLIGKYHKMRFFERQKATKRLKKAKKTLQNLETGVDEQEAQQLQEEIENFEVDLNYAMYYPLDKPYSPLYPGDRAKDDLQTDRHKIKGDPAMRALVRECMNNGKLDALRNGKLTTTSHDEPAQINKKTSQIKSRPARKAKQSDTGGVRDKDEEHDQNDDSDGGFFE